MFIAYKAYMAEREKHERLELLYESSRLLHYAPELDSAIGALLDHARRMFRAERADLLLFPDPTLATALRSSSGAADGPETMVPVTVEIDDPLRSRISREGRAFSARPGPGWTTGADTIREAMVGPLVGEGGVIGALTIINRLGEGTNFEPDDLRLLETVANQAAVALENGQLEQSLHELSRLKEELRHQAFHDSLTGLPNRPAFVEEVELRREAVVEGAPPSVVIFLDLDDFKIVNDTQGHAAGDELLVAVAERIGEQLRPDDLVARFGGDEFALLPAAGSTRRGRAGHDPADHHRAGAAVPGPGHGRRRRLQRRDQHRPGRLAGGRGPAQRRRRDVPGQGRRQAARAGVRPDHAQLHRRAARAHVGPRPEHQPR